MPKKIDETHLKKQIHDLNLSLSVDNFTNVKEYIKHYDQFTLDTAITTSDLLEEMIKKQKLLQQTPKKEQFSPTCIDLIHKVSVPALNIAITRLDRDQNDLLLTSAYLDSQDILVALLEKADIKVIEQILFPKDWKRLKITALHVICFKRHKAALELLINKFSNINTLGEVTLFRDCYGKNVADYALTCLNHEWVGLLFAKLNPADLMLVIQRLTDENLKRFRLYMFTQSTFRTAILNNLNTDGLKALLKFYNKRTQSMMGSTERMLIITDILTQLGDAVTKNITIKTNKEKPLTFNHNLIKLIKQEGFYSYADAAILLHRAKGTPHFDELDDLIKKLIEKDLLLCGGLTLYQFDAKIDDSLQQKINNFEILYKVIKPDNFDDYLAQFQDYHQRPKDLRITKPNATHKFFHLTGNIAEYEKHPQHDCQKQRIKKNSTTLLSPQLITPVFGEQHNDDRPLVGLIFDLNQCVIKAMLKYDRGTINHGWVGTETEVTEYKNKIASVNFTDFEKFKQAIESSHQLNEVLAEIPKEAIMGVFIRNHSESSINTALSYAEKIKNALNIDLTIYHYDNLGKNIIPYPKELMQQHLDFITLKKNQALQLYQTLVGHQYRLFGGGYAYYSTEQKKLIPLSTTAYKIVTELDSAIKNNNFAEILQVLDKAEKMLSLNTTKTIERHKTTVELYQSCLTLLQKR